MHSLFSQLSGCRVRVPHAIGVLLAAMLMASAMPPPARASYRSLVLRAERGIRTCINDERAKRGLRPLQDSRTLDRAAHYHASNMLRYDFFDHTDPWGQGPAERVARFDRARALDFIGENIGAGYRSTRAACSGWMHSPGHRANILDRDYTVMGAGFAKGHSGYGSYFVQDFGVVKSSTPPSGSGGDTGSGGSQGTGNTPGSSGGGGSPGPPPATHHVVVRLFNVDDQETLFVNGSQVATVGYGQDQTIDLGQLSASDSVYVKVENFAGGYTWGIQETSDGATVLDDEAGTLGQDGANNNDQTTGPVHDTTFDSSGAVSETYTYQP